MVRPPAQPWSANVTTPTLPVHTMHQRPYPASRPPSTLSRLSSSASRLNLAAMQGVSRFSQSRESLLPSTMPNETLTSGKTSTSESVGGSEPNALLCGLPLKYVSLITLAIQNATLAIVMHYSRVSTPASRAYSPAAAVLLCELAKGSISYLIALMRVPSSSSVSSPITRRFPSGLPVLSPLPWTARLRQLNAEIFSPDCVKLSIPAILYVIQNSLQFVAISNLPVASFQVAYQMKIMTTAAFSVALLGKGLTRTKWVALLFLAVGVGIVQVQTSVGNNVSSHTAAVGSAAAAAPKHMHVMNPLKGFAAVTAACFTSGLAGVYFEMVLKGSKADLWVRNVQLSLFSIIPAVLPIIYNYSPAYSGGILGGLLNNFGVWAWATVAIQVFGGLVTAVVIKYSDNILKGFATSLSILLSFLASVVLFNFRITPSFLVGSSTVLVATWMYNQPAPKEKDLVTSVPIWEKGAHAVVLPVSRDDSIIGQPPPEKPSLRKSLSFGSSQSLASVLGMTPSERSRASSPISSEPSSPGTTYPTSGQWRH